jgi:hypothetical protein
MIGNPPRRTNENIHRWNGHQRPPSLAIGSSFDVPELLHFNMSNMNQPQSIQTPQNCNHCQSSQVLQQHNVNNSNNAHLHGCTCGSFNTSQETPSEWRNDVFLMNVSGSGRQGGNNMVTGTGSVELWNTVEQQMHQYAAQQSVKSANVNSIANSNCNLNHSMLLHQPEEMASLKQNIANNCVSALSQQLKHTSTTIANSPMGVPSLPYNNFDESVLVESATEHHRSAEFDLKLSVRNP